MENVRLYLISREEIIDSYFVRKDSYRFKFPFYITVKMTHFNFIGAPSFFFPKEDFSPWKRETQFKSPYLLSVIKGEQKSGRSTNVFMFIEDKVFSPIDFQFIHYKNRQLLYVFTEFRLDFTSDYPFAQPVFTF